MRTNLVLSNLLYKEQLPHCPYGPFWTSNILFFGLLKKKTETVRDYFDRDETFLFLFSNRRIGRLRRAVSGRPLPTFRNIDISSGGLPELFKYKIRLN